MNDQPPPAPPPRLAPFLAQWDYIEGVLLERLEGLKDEEDLVWPLTAAEGVAFMREGLRRWRSALDHMTDKDLDTVGRSAFRWGLDPELPLIEIVWWVNKELIYHAGEIWLMRDLYAVWQGQIPAPAGSSGTD